MLKKILLILPLSIILLAFSIPEKTARKADKVISKFYETDTFEKEFLSISSELNSLTKSNFSDDNFFMIKRNSEFLGYGYIGNAPSKTATFDYLVLFDKNFVITKSKVLIYREEYGGEIGSKRWLKQFIGKSIDTPEIDAERNIIPISGATISVRSMTNAINDLLRSVDILQKKEAL